MYRSARFWTAVMLAAVAPEVRAQTSYPMVTRVGPCALQRGQAAEVTIAGTQNFSGASRLLFEGDGLTAEVADAGTSPQPDASGRMASTSTVRARFAASPDAPLGPREFRVVTPQGVSSVGVLLVVPDPVVVEGDDKANDQPGGAQALALPVAVAGTVGKLEDVDWYAITVKAGQRVTFSLWGNRLEDKIHNLQQHLDPILTLHDPRGRELAANDNRDFADPMLSHEFRDAGTYLIQVRDTTYAGNPNWSYVLQASSGPYATSVFPMAVNPGARAELHASGFNFDPAQVVALDVPPEVPPGIRAFPLPTAEGRTYPFPVVVTELPLAAEAADAPPDGEQARALAPPVALSGRLGGANDVDGYRFEAAKGAIYAFEVISRRAGATTDPVLRVLDAGGKTLAEADDTTGLGKDSRLEWTAPTTGSFTVQVADLHSRGGEGFGYVLRAEPAKPEIVLNCDPDKLNLGPGARTPVFVKVERRGGFRGPVTLEWAGLPAGVSASPLTIPPQMTQGLIVVAAADDAPQGAALVTLSGKAETPEGMVSRLASPKQEIYLPGGGRGLYGVETLAVAVTRPSDITLDVRPSEVSLAPGGTVAIDVTVVRHGGYDKGVNLAVDLLHLGRSYGSPLPPGVTLKEAASKTLLGPNDTAGRIVLEARPDAAPIVGVPIAVLGHVSIDFVVKMTFCSAPIRLTVK